MDMYGENRTVAHEGTVGRKEKTDSFSRDRWLDNSAKLLDHYCACFYSPLFFWLMRALVLLTEERTSKDPVKGVETKKFFVTSRVRPLPPSTERPLNKLVF